MDSQPRAGPSSLASLLNPVPAPPDLDPADPSTFGSIDSESEDVRIAVSALDHMRNAHRYRDESGSLESSTVASTSGNTLEEDDRFSEGTGITVPYSDRGKEDVRFLERVGKMSVVSGALRAYEVGKNSNRVVKYGAGLVETSVKTIYGPVLNRAGQYVGSNNLNRVEEFANRQLDRFTSSPATRRDSLKEDFSESESDAMDVRGDGRIRRRTSRSVSRSSVSSNAGSATEKEGEVVVAVGNKEAQTSRRGWQGMLVEAGMTAGGIGAAVSEESLKSLKYCLHWLQYASARLEHQLAVLQNFISSLSAPAPSDALISPSAVHTLTQIRRDVVDTIRKVVDVVAKYSGAALPEHARRFVKQSIMSLPGKWANTIRSHDSMSQDGSVPSSPAPINLSAAPGTLAAGDGMTKENAEAAADRVLNFTVESLEMVKGINRVFAESVERAELWVDRLESVGLAQRQRNAEPTMSGEGENKQIDGGVSMEVDH
ncbi:Opi1-domain-containing protein [Atractiella rhizophila]|nr:Opi1-domain-containing protein [Atractiella rhizophila]